MVPGGVFNLKGWEPVAGVAKRTPGKDEKCISTPEGLQRVLKPLRGKAPFRRMTRGVASLTPGLPAETPPA